MLKIKTNDLKKGDWVRLANGWMAQVADNMRGNTRMCEVYGFHTEIGSVYSHDIVYKTGNPATDPSIKAEIEHTPAQIKLRATLRQMGM